MTMTNEHTEESVLKDMHELRGYLERHARGHHKVFSKEFFIYATSGQLMDLIPSVDREWYERQYSELNRQLDKIRKNEEEL